MGNLTLDVLYLSDSLLRSSSENRVSNINRDYQDLSVSHVSGTFPSGTTL